MIEGDTVLDPIVNFFTRVFLWIGRGIGYGIGVWHVPMMVLDAPGTFIVLMHRLAPERDEEWHSLAEPIEVAAL